MFESVVNEVNLEFLMLKNLEHVEGKRDDELTRNEITDTNDLDVGVNNEPNESKN